LDPHRENVNTAVRALGSFDAARVRARSARATAASRGLEEFAVIKDGQSYRSADMNFWGIAFADDNRFYASMSMRVRRYLVSGDIAARQAHPAVASLGLGEADLRSELGVTGDEGLAWARSRIVVAARAAGLPPPAMSVYANVSDVSGLAASCAAGPRLGFIGRAAIHPRQVPVIVDAFRPAEDVVSRARELLAAVAEAETRDSGTVVLADGRFADRAMVAAAQRTVALAARYA
jgi:HpcH/HpaI aldolase/citrate lyase family